MENYSQCVKSSKNDVWTLGMILLHMGLLQNQQTCYEEECRKINWVKVYQNLEQLERLYGAKVRGLVGCMLESNRKDRPTWTELKQVFSEKCTNE